MGDFPIMPYNPIRLAALIICLTPLLARAQAPDQAPAAVPPATPAPAPAPQQTPAEHQIDVATVQVRVMERIAAKIEQDVDMLNQKFKLEGAFYKDTGHRIRLELNLVGMVGDSNSTMLQVCDGKVLWDFQRVLKMESYRKREITPILKKLEDPVLDENFRILVISNLGFGGPEAMLSGLRKAVLFDQISEEKLDGVDVWVIGGKWRDRSTLIDLNGRPLSPTAPLPPYIPSNVRVFIGKIDAWPYKIEMIGNAPSLLQEDVRATDPATGRPVGQPRKPPKVDPSKVTLRYKILPTSEIKEGLFKFAAPADVAATSVKDETEEFLTMLDQVIQGETQKKKAAAAKAEADQPLLKAPPIEIPTPPASGGLGTVPPREGSTPK
jgi:hypothetical protein